MRWVETIGLVFLKLRQAVRSAWVSVKRQGSWLLPLLVIVATVVGGFLLVRYGPDYLLGSWRPDPSSTLSAKDWLDLENSYRATLVQIIGGIVIAALALFYTVSQNRHSAESAREEQITARFTQAISQLGSERPNGTQMVGARLGAIFVLERVARDSPRDHWTVMETLTAYVRENSPWLSQSQKSGMVRPPLDVLAALTVIGRRNPGPEAGRDLHLDLRGTDLRGADLTKAHLERAWLFGEAHLEGAWLWEAHLEGADASDIHLEGAHLERAFLRGAKLRNAHLEGAAFWVHTGLREEKEAADLTGADLSGADLTGADLQWVDLSKTIGLTPDQVQKAVRNKQTKLPFSLPSLGTAEPV